MVWDIHLGVIMLDDATLLFGYHGNGGFSVFQDSLSLFSSFAFPTEVKLHTSRIYLLS